LVNARDLEQRRDAGRVVDRTVVDVVARDGRALAEMIPVRRVDDVLVAQLRVAAFELAFQNYYQQIATPFEWRFTKADFAALLRKLGDQSALAAVA
jgi:hypothetical protein